MNGKSGSRLPEQFVRGISSLHREKGERWLADLPDLIGEIAEKWSLVVGEPCADLFYNYVVPCARANGEQAVLKIGFAEKDSSIFNEAKFLRRSDGAGTVRLLKCDEKLCALLIERLIPGKTLRETCAADDERSTQIAIALLRRIHDAARQPEGFPSLESWTDSFQKAEKVCFAPSHVEKARDYFAALGDASGQKLLLHGDFHHGNILSAGGASFLAIDPKGIVGDIGYEIAVFLNNPRGWLLSQPNRAAICRRRIEIFAEAFAVAPRDLRKWAFAEAVLSAWWTLEDGATIEEAEKWLACAEIWGI